jgi:hypothetical protein
MAGRLLGAAAACALLVGTGAAPAPAAAATPASCGLQGPDRTITGEFGSELQGSYVLLPFDVPAGQTAIRVRFCHDQPETPLAANQRHTLDLDMYGPRAPGALWGEREFRGSSGSARREGESGRPQVTISQDGFGVPGGTTRSMRPGPIGRGQWAVQLPVAAVVSREQGDLDGKVAFRVEIDLISDPAFADQPFRRAAYRTTPARREAGWYSGDLHVHADHSEGGATMKEAFDFAFRGRPQGGAGLDFVSLTDHNTDSAHMEIPSFQPRYPGKLIVRGTEVTTFRGHLMNHGTGRYLDHRTGPVYEGRVGSGGRLEGLTLRRPARGAAETLRAIKNAGGFNQINHPTIFPSEVPAFANLCRGCSWSYSDAETGYGSVDAIEVATGPSGLDSPGQPGPNPFTATAIDFWEDKLAKGFHIAAIGVSDSHDAGETTGPTSAPIGEATTVVRAEELSEAAVECGVEAGHTYVKVSGSGGPDLRFEATPPGFRGAPAIMGDTVRGPGAAFKATVTGGDGRTLIVFRDGEPFRSVAVAGNDFITTFDAAGPGRYRLQLQRGSAIDTVSSPIWSVAGAPAVLSRDCRPLRVRGKARRRIRVSRRGRFLTRCRASGAGLNRCSVAATIRVGPRRRVRKVAAGRVRMTGGSRRVRMRLTRAGRRVLRVHGRRGRGARVVFTAVGAEGERARARKHVRLLRTPRAREKRRR